MLMMMAVEEVGRSLVLPSHPTHKHHIVLPAFDTFWQYIHYNQRLLFYPNVIAPSSSSYQVVQKLKTSLASCLVHFYPWCGRLALHEDHRLVIDCNDAGVDFVEACTDLPMSELAQTGYQMMPFFEKLCQHIEHKGDCLYSSPLLSIQATFFSDGGMVLGITQSHVVADGQSLWNFMVSWGECARGISPLSMVPTHDREQLDIHSQPSSEMPAGKLTIDFGEDDDEEEDPRQASEGTEHANGLTDRAKSITMGIEPSLETTQTDHGEARSDAAMAGVDDRMVQCLFNLSASSIKRLKSDAGGTFTSLEVTCAHFWKHVTAARQSLRRESTHFFVAVNCRSRLVPPLPSSYFGNVISAAMSFSRVGKICRESLHNTANRIHESVAKVQHDYIVNTLRSLETSRKKNVLTEFASAIKGKGLNVASSPRFPVYQVDFGWGKPTAVRAARVDGDGELVFFGGHPAANQGDMEICIALPGSVLKLLLEDPQFVATSPHSPFYNRYQTP